jgi:hypothetical protein
MDDQSMRRDTKPYWGLHFHLLCSVGSAHRYLRLENRKTLPVSMIAGSSSLNVMTSRRESAATCSSESALPHRKLTTSSKESLILLVAPRVSGVEDWKPLQSPHKQIQGGVLPSQLILKLLDSAFVLDHLNPRPASHSRSSIWNIHLPQIFR